MINTTCKNLISFIKNSPTCFHAIASIKKILNREGFVELLENKPFNIQYGGKYYVIRNDSSLIAFKIGTSLDHYAFNVVASHSDSPCFKIKPIETFGSDGYYKLNVEGYGGMLRATWFDRPLSIAGRVIVKNNDQIVSKLINFDKNMLSIPSVAIHFNRNANDNASYSLACDMFPTISENNVSLTSLIAKENNLNENDIIAHDLYVYNRQEGYFWGANDEFLSSPKLDDLQCAYTTLMGFIKSVNTHNVSVYCCFDNEEVGSSTRQGANSDFLDNTLLKISLALKISLEKHLAALGESFMISSDNAHAVSPNHPELTDCQNKVYMNKGIVIKYNASQSYTSDALSSAIFKEICQKVNVPYQVFTNKSGTPGGSTLGNIATRHVSLMSVDIGLPQLAMHSCLETSGTLDADYLVKAIKKFYETTIIINDNKEITLLDE